MLCTKHTVSCHVKRIQQDGERALIKILIQAENVWAVIPLEPMFRSGLYRSFNRLWYIYLVTAARDTYMYIHSSWGIALQKHMDALYWALERTHSTTTVHVVKVILCQLIRFFATWQLCVCRCKAFCLLKSKIEAVTAVTFVWRDVSVQTLAL